MKRADLPGESRRGNVRTVRGMWLRSERLRLTGRADIVEFRPEPYPGGVQAGQEQARRLRYRTALRTGALPGGDVADSHCARRDLLWQPTPAAGDRLYAGASRTNRRARRHDAPPVSKPGDAAGELRSLLPQLLAGRCVPAAGHRSSRRRRALGGAATAFSATGGLAPPSCESCSTRCM